MKINNGFQTSCCELRSAEETLSGFRSEPSEPHHIYIYIYLYICNIDVVYTRSVYSSLAGLQKDNSEPWSSKRTKG